LFTNVEISTVCHVLMTDQQDDRAARGARTASEFVDILLALSPTGGTTPSPFMPKILLLTAAPQEVALDRPVGYGTTAVSTRRGHRFVFSEAASRR